jgi:hypothetical protein
MSPRKINFFRLSNHIPVTSQNTLIQYKTIRINQVPVAAFVPNMFCCFYSAENHKIANNSTTTEAKEKISSD